MKITRSIVLGGCFGGLITGVTGLTVLNWQWHVLMLFAAGWATWERVK